VLREGIVDGVKDKKMGRAGDLMEQDFWKPGKFSISTQSISL